MEFKPDFSLTNFSQMNKDEKFSLLLAMIQENFINVVEFIVRSGDFLDHLDKYSGSPLITALQQPVNLDMLDLLLRYGAKVNPKSTWNGLYPLQLALRRKLPDHVIHFLLNFGAAVDKSSADGQSVLMEAVKDRRSISIIRRLVAAGADVNVVETCGRERPLLMVAVETYAQSCAHSSTASPGRRLHTVDGYREAGLADESHQIGVMDSFEEIVSLLLSANADVNVTDNLEKTPLMSVIESDISQVRTVERFIQRGANVNATDLHGNSPLLLALTTVSGSQHRRQLRPFEKMVSVFLLLLGCGAVITRNDHRLDKFAGYLFEEAKLRGDLQLCEKIVKQYR